MTRRFAGVFFLLLVTSFSFSLAQRCLPELQAVLSAPSERASGRDAARLLERAVNELEPSLPPLFEAPSELLPFDDADYETVRFLAERGLLPPDWQPDTLEAGVWVQMLSRLAGWYDQTPPLVAAELTNQDLAETLSGLIDEIAPGLEPVALVVSDPRDSINPDAVIFWAVARKVSPYPRMIVSRPPASVSLEGGVESVLGGLETCATPITRFVYAPLATAEKLFLANNAAQMVIVRTDPPSPQDLFYVPEGEETAYFDFTAPDLAGVRQYAVLFVGPSIGVPALLRIIPQLRTNMGPRQIINLVLGP